MLYQRVNIDLLIPPVQSVERPKIKFRELRNILIKIIRSDFNHLLAFGLNHCALGR
ncbi:hypothetical protein HMPREF0454_02683 [Hafnia alvei ATCC 51873]|uniref:Uncharacterized protein n=1 Tax=Hafnia alvei ATCC 51873 TaxID=1002364 RepID=G9Y7Z7_HAFAL|nr:hypothetical protein HMPREF0454_02683 [Hafnia alvei ATCC 51873]